MPNNINVVSADANPKKLHRPSFHGKGKTWIAKRVTGKRHLKLNPSLSSLKAPFVAVEKALPPTADLQHLPPVTPYTVASTVFGVFATGGVGTGAMFLTDTIAKAAKANMAHPAYGPVRDITRLAFEGIFGVSIIPFIASKAGGKDIGKAFWLGGTVLAGIDLGVTVFKYVAMGFIAARDKTVPDTTAQPATQEAGMAMLGLSGLSALLKGVHTQRPPSGTSTPDAVNVDGADIMAELEAEKAKFHELSNLVKGTGGLSKVGNAGSLIH